MNNRNSDRQKDAREKMVEEQLANPGPRLSRKAITDQRVLDAMRRVPRHLFLEGIHRHRAYEDGALPIGEGQTISQPFMVALMSEALRLTGSETVLEIGTGSGYQAAVLAELAQRVFTVERIPVLAGRARKVLDSLGYRNVLVKLADGTLGWKEYAPYDRIMVTAGAPAVPEPLIEQLVPGGIMVIPVGTPGIQVLTRITRKEDGSIMEERMEGCVFVKLVGRHGWEEGTA